MIKNLTILLLISISQMLTAQISFTDSSEKLGNKFVNSGAAIGVADMNGDGLDDIIRLHSTTQLVIDEQTTSGDFNSNVTGINSPQAVWSLCIGDVDRNGSNDVFLATANHFHRMAYGNNTDTGFTEEILDGPAILPQASNMVDINNDGKLDLFVCNDNGINLPYQGDGKTLHHTPDLINTATTIMSDNSGNYGSVWIDYDNDQDQDLFIAKCRLGVENPMDPRRINQLFENDGNGNYTEVAAIKGLVPFEQSWSIDFGDIDNDGDLDAFMINHRAGLPNILYENDGNGNFTNITSGAGFSPSINNLGAGIQVKFADFDNDGFLDLLLTSAQNGWRCYRNNGDKTFTVTFSAFQTLDLMQSFALGDLNNDGFLDVMGGFGRIFNEPTMVFDKLFLNNKTGNNWIRVNLTGTNSNINGIGARIELHGPWGVQLREIRSGESYGICNSLSANFGIGGATSIESMVIKWPSGFIQTIDNPAINQVHEIEEGGCVSPPDTYIQKVICQGENFVFEDQTYNQTGAHAYDYFLPDGCDSTIIIELEVLPSYEIITEQSICEGGIITFSDGATQVVTQAGEFVESLLTQEGCDSILRYDIDILPTFMSTESFTVCQGETYTWPDGTSSVILDSQSYTSNIFSEFNCDSTVVTSLNVIPAPNSQEYIEVCRGETYTFEDGNTLIINEETIYDISYPVNGSCDSIANFIVSLYPEYNIVESDIGCFGGVYTFPDGVAFGGLTQDFSYTSFLETENGCDSIILINLSLEEGSESFENIEACEGENYTFPDGSQEVISQNISQISVLTNQFGCDSIINTNISSKQSYQFTLTQMICSGDNYTFFDGTTEFDVTEDLMHDSNFLTFDGCDSIITTALVVVPPIYSFSTGLVCQGETYVFPDGTVMANINSETTQESLFTGSNGCDSIVVTTVEVSPAYNQQENYILCIDEMVNIPGIDINTFENDTTIVINGTTTLGCDSTSFFFINVDIIDNNVVLNQATVTATAVDVDYQWFDCNDMSTPIPGATNQSFTPDFDGEYFVTLTGPTGCNNNSDCISITGVATADPMLSSKIKVFPNPALDKIQLLTEDIPTVLKATIYDINGRAIQQLDLDSMMSHDVSGLTTGLYLIKVETIDGYGLKRFVKI